MLLKAKIIDREGYKYKIRIPQYHGIPGEGNYTPDSQLPLASVCLSHKKTKPYNKDDIVFVSFENDSIDKPVIMGLLFTKDVEED